MVRGSTDGLDVGGPVDSMKKEIPRNGNEGKSRLEESQLN